MDTPETPEPAADDTQSAPTDENPGPDGMPRWAMGLFAMLAVVLLAQVAIGWVLVDRTNELAVGLDASEAESTRVAARLDAIEAEVGALGEAAANSSTVEAPSAVAGGLPAFPRSGPDPALGMSIPDITGTDHYTGEEVRLGVGDKATITMVWAHWCPHCQREVPMLADVVASGALDAYDAVQVQSVTTFIDDSRPNPLLPYLEELQLAFPVIVDDDGAIMAKLGMQAVPAWIVTNADGEVLGRFTGAIGEDAFLSVVEEVQRVATQGGA